MISVISNSFLFDGFKVFAYSITLLSYIYNPVTQKLDFGFIGFSSMLSTLPTSSKDKTPYDFGLSTSYAKIVELYLPSSTFLQDSHIRFTVLSPTNILSPRANITLSFFINSEPSKNDSAIPFGFS